MTTAMRRLLMPATIGRLGGAEGSLLLPASLAGVLHSHPGQGGPGRMQDVHGSPQGPGISGDVAGTWSRGFTSLCGTLSYSARAVAWLLDQRLPQQNWAQIRGFSSLPAPDYALGLHNLRDNPGARRQRIRVGRGDSARRGNYSGRGMKGQKARGRAHILYDGGQLGLIKFPVTREKPPFEVLYNQLSLYRVVEFVQLGLLDPSRVITMKDLKDSGCVKDIKYGVLLYGQETCSVGFPLHLQVTACEASAQRAVKAAGGSVLRVYYTATGLKALLHPEQYTRAGLPLPLPPPRWHPRHDGRFDAMGQLPPETRLPGPDAAAAVAALPQAAA